MSHSLQTMPKDTKCARCGKDGHWARNCTVQRTSCFKCGQSTHWARDCPSQGVTPAEQSAIQQKLDEMQKRLDAHDKSYEAHLRKTYEKEKEAFAEDSFDEGPISFFPAWEDYKKGHVDPIYMGMEHTYTDRMKEAVRIAKINKLDQDILDKEVELKKLKEAKATGKI